MDSQGSPGNGDTVTHTRHFLDNASLISLLPTPAQFSLLPSPPGVSNHHLPSELFPLKQILASGSASGGIQTETKGLFALAAAKIKYKMETKLENSLST